jgi:hypothetical protein
MLKNTMNKHELISIFSKGTCANGSDKMIYNPQGLINYGKIVSGIKDCKWTGLKVVINSVRKKP